MIMTIICIILSILLITNLVLLFYIHNENKHLKKELISYQNLYKFYFQKSKKYNNDCLILRKRLKQRNLINKIRNQEIKYKFGNLFYLLRTKIKELINFIKYR